MKSVQIRNISVFNPKTGKYGPEITSYLDTFHAVLVRSEILGLFENTSISNHLYCLHRWEKLQQQVQALLSQKRKTFSGIFISFSESTQNFAHFEEKDQLHSFII